MWDELICFKIFNQVFCIFLIGNLKTLSSLKINLFKKIIIFFIELNNKILKAYEIVIYILYFSIIVNLPQIADSDVYFLFKNLYIKIAHNNIILTKYFQQ